MAEFQVVLLVLDEAMLLDVLRAIGIGKQDPPVIVELAQGAAAGAVARAHDTHRRSALAVVASNDADAIEAIASGADEALTFPVVDARAIELLVERASSRARNRLMYTSEQNRAAHAEKLAALGTVVAGVAHEINNPLQSITMHLDLATRDIVPLVKLFDALAERANLQRPLSSMEVRKLVEEARTGSSISEMRTLLSEMEIELKSIADIVRDLRIYARSDENDPADIIEVPDLLDRVIRTVTPQVRTRGHIERDYAANLPTLVLPRSRVVQVLTNIMVNAAQAIAEVQRPVHRIRVSARSDGDFVAVSISDTGPGITPDTLDRIFDPFYTTKAPGKGTGLGLAISQSIMRELGGDLLAESVHGEGATFIVLLPVADPDVLEAVMKSKRDRQRDDTPNAKRPTVLIVEDDERLLRVYPQTLHGQYDVIVAAHGQEAIDLLASGSNADLVLTDLAMPVLDGQELFAWLTENRPELAKKTIFVTAGAHNDAGAAFLRGTTNLVLEKPVTREALLAALHRTFWA